MGVPYFPVDRGDSINHGFFNLRNNPDLIPRVPEVIGWPELIELLYAINRPSGIFWSLGIEKAFNGITAKSHPHVTTKLVSYVDVAFADVPLNADQTNFERLATAIHQFGSQRKIAELINIDMELGVADYAEQRLRGWCMTIWIGGFGASEDDARKAWYTVVKVFTDFFNNDWTL